MGIEWVYEPEGINLGEKIFYLPDFWLPQVRMYAEVKAETLKPMEYRKCKWLARQSGRPVLMLVGPPDFKNYNAIEKDTWSDEMIEWDYSLVERYLHTEHRFPCANYCQPEHPESYGIRYHDAVWASRAARFEFGEIANVIYAAF
jgi:hypothetical protein